MIFYIVFNLNPLPMSFNIDIHCHSSSKPFMSRIGQQKHTPFETYNFEITHPIYQMLRKPLQQFSKIRFTTQSNFDHMYQGGVRVAMISITPIEKAFTVLNPQAASFKSQLMQTFLKEKSNYRDGFLSSYAINALTGYHVKDIDDVKGKYYDVFNDLFMKEMQYLSSFQNQKGLNGQYSIRFPKNYQELSNNIQDDRILNIIITLEGAHALGQFETLQTIQQGVHNTHMTDSNQYALGNQLCKNLKEIRTKFPIPIFSISLCHHFWNGLAGHARSLNNLMSEIVNQEEGINSGLQTNGKMLIAEMAKTTYNQQKVSPIHVDIKHMSPQSRKEYYQYRKSTPDLRQTPIICSHTGISMSFETLDAWIHYVQNNPLEKEGKQYAEGAYYLHEKSINLCREDLVEIYHAKGIIGIQLDEKRIMGPLALEELNKKHKAGDEDQLKYVYAKTIWANIFCVIDEIKEAGVADLRKAWDMICIGSDFDGLINHLACFESAAKMEALKYTMGYFLEEPQGIPLYYKDAQNQYTLSIEKMEQLKAGYSNHALIDKIFNQNAMQFLRDNF